MNRTRLVRVGVAVLTVLLFVAFRGISAVPGIQAPVGQSLNNIVHVFSCCLFTWEVVTTLVPAFFLAGAVAVFIPPSSVVRYMGAQTKKGVAYGTATLSGLVLEICACNVVPLFLGIYRSGAGLGPAIAFLYSGPALNILSVILVFRLIGWKIGLARLLGHLILPILVGMAMAGLFRREEQERQTVASAKAPLGPMKETRVLLGFFTFLLAIVIIGASGLAPAIKLPLLGLFMIPLGVVTVRYFDREEVGDWFIETGKLAELIIPILLPAVLVIGLVVTFVPVSLVLNGVGGEQWWAVLLASVFGSLMYFPLLTEVIFVKAFLKMGMSVGPGLALLLTGPGLSLPTMLLVHKTLGLKKLSLYVLLVVVLSTGAGLLFATILGPYSCLCTEIPLHSR
jgi:uncharacterized membrane protein YraQ (UPF0718 family)